MPVRDVVGDDVDDRADPELERLADQSLGLGERAEGRIDRPVVGDVIAAIGHRRRIPGREPHRVDAEVPQIGEPGAHSCEVAGPVAVRVGEASDIDLVDDGVAPPGVVVSGHRCLCQRAHGSAGVADRARPVRSTDVPLVDSATWSGVRTQRNIVNGSMQELDRNSGSVDRGRQRKWVLWAGWRTRCVGRRGPAGPRPLVRLADQRAADGAMSNRGFRRLVRLADQRAADGAESVDSQSRSSVGPAGGPGESEGAARAARPQPDPLSRERRAQARRRARRAEPGCRRSGRRGAR